MDDLQPSAGITQGTEEWPGFRPLAPYGSTQPCCEPVPHIRAEHLSIAYHGHPALDKVSFTINRGCITALVGPSGCGKTSFLMSVNRLTDLLPACHVSGRLFIDDLNVFAPTTNVLHLRRTVGMIFQKPTVFPFSIKKNLELPLREHGMRDHAALARTSETALRQVGLWEEVKNRMDRPAQTLSGGQQQRLCLARALVLSPDILLLDEPCSALDPISSGVIEDLIVSLRGHYTVLIVTHNLAQARRIADHVAFFWSFDGVGRLVENGPAHKIFENPQHELTAAYISGMRG
jgi:phosphate transport system ATP-binding protein